jgi:hypothetical protein
LPSSVPNFKHDESLAALNFSESKIEANGGEITLMEDVVGESEEETAFWDIRIPN